MPKTILIATLILCHLACENRPSHDLRAPVLIDQIAKVDEIPQAISFTNSFPVNNVGGHLQGIQPLYQGEQSYAVISGSSSTLSYYGMIKLDGHPHVIAIQKILDKPFKHAGGFQVHDQYMAVGIEDNDARNHSFVFLYDLSSPENPPTEPFQKIERMGPFERATAGCVGLTYYLDHWLIVVGDWDTRNLDFYTSKEIGNQLLPFKLSHTINISEADNSTWSDPEWLPYQNINLFQENDVLYLVGMTSDSIKNNVADVYEINTADLSTFSLKKVARKILNNQGEDFIWGAGLDVKNETIRGVISCQRNLDSLSELSYYSIKN